MRTFLIIATIITGIAGNAFANSCKGVNIEYARDGLECCIDRIAYLAIYKEFIVKIDPKTDKPQHCNY